jgi:hypothetical protein
MNEQKQRIAIAEACGWSDFEDEIHTTITYNWAYYKGERSIVPDYLNDLNAMASAEEILVNQGLGTKYGERLLIVREHPEPSMARGWDIWIGASATAAQRAEAFLRTIGKWEEGT